MSTPAAMPLQETISLKGRGIHQVRVSLGGKKTSTVSLSLPRPTAWGVSFQNGSFEPWPGQPARMFFYVPVHAEELEFSSTGSPLRILDENGEELLKTAPEDTKRIKVHVMKTEVVWSIEFADIANWSFHAAGFPLILCPTPEAARTIRGSVEVLPDGTVVCHKFQRRIAELLPTLLAIKNVGVAEALIVPPSSRKDEWLKDPLRNRNLLWDLVPSIAPTLRGQNLDPTSHWAGSLSSWPDRLKLPPPENRWDRLKSVEGLAAGISPRDPSAENLAQIARLDAPFNPYFGKRELLYRAAAAALADLMTLGEDEVWRGVGADMDDHPGFMAFAGPQKAQVFALAAPEMPDDIRDVWTEGLRRVVDRHFADRLTTARNQSSHNLVTLQCFAEGSGDSHYRQLTQSWARRFVAAQHPAGFHMEEMGPDATYIGMTHWHEAVYYRRSANRLILESLRRSYYFFNHTVAPEPHGKVLGGFNFSHRTGGAFHDEQWGGAKGILDDVLPEVGLWAAAEPTADEISKAASDLARMLPASPNRTNNNINVPRYLYWSQPDRSGTWPAQEKKSFLRDLGGELVAVKRPAYYAAIYVGKPATDFYIRKREDFRAPLPNHAEDNGGEIDFRKVTPFLGGGLTLFWTPTYGNAVLAANWSPLTHHGLVAVATDGQRYWEDYLATTYRLNARAGSLEITGRIEGQPLVYTRSYRFKDDTIEVQVRIKAEQPASFDAFFENVPVAQGTGKADGAEIKTAGNGFQIHDKHGNGVGITLERSRPLRIQPNGLRHSQHGDVLQIGRTEIELPARLAAGQEIVLLYTIRPIVAAGS